MPTNTQTPSPVEQASDRLSVHSIWPTIQGEGPFAGEHAIFVRLNGCNLQCPFCDTEYTKPGPIYSNEDTDEGPDLLDFIADVQKHQIIRNRMTVGNKQLVVITGGEPFRQHIAPVLRHLVLGGYKVQIETNGTLYQDIHQSVVVVCSPKTPRIHDALAQRANAYKYILDAGHVAEDGLPRGTLGKYGHTARPPEGWDGDIFVQPLDEGDDGQGEFGAAAARNREHLQACVQSVLRFGYRLCIQTHKIANVA